MRITPSSFLSSSAPKQLWTIAQNVLVLSGGEIISRLFLTLFYIFSARHLGVAGFGVFSTALAITVIFANFADLGISYLITREVSRDYNLASRYISNVIIFKFVVFIIIFGIQFGIVKALHYSSSVTNAVLILSFFILFNSLILSFNSIFQAFERMIYIAISKFVGSFVLLSGSLFLVHSNAGVNLYCILYVVSSLLTLLYGFFLLRAKFVIFHFRWEFSLLKSIIKKAIPFGLISIFVPFYYWSGTVFLSFARGDTEVGLYNASAHLVSGLAFLGGAFLSAIYPLMSREGITSQGAIESILERCFRYMILLAMPLWIFVMISSERIITTFYGSNYIQAIPILGILVWWGFFLYINGVWANFFYSIDKQSVIMKQSFVALIINLCLNIVFTPKYGIIGTSIAIVSAEIFSFGLLTRQFIISGYKISLKNIGLSTFKIVVAAFLSSLLVYFIKGQALVIIFIFFFSSYFVFCYILRAFGLNEVSAFKYAIELLLRRKW